MLIFLMRDAEGRKKEANELPRVEFTHIPLHTLDRELYQMSYKAAHVYMKTIPRKLSTMSRVNKNCNSYYTDNVT